VHRLGVLALAVTTTAGAVTLDLGTATIALDGKGCVTSLRAANGTEYAPPGAPPAFAVETDQGTLDPSTVTRDGDALTVVFGDAGRVRFTVTEGKGFAFLEVADLALPATAQRLQLFCLPVKPLKTRGSAINACYDESFATAVMGTEINVRPPESGRSRRLPGD
jgi:hypothetical protein